MSKSFFLKLNYSFNYQKSEYFPFNDLAMQIKQEATLHVTSPLFSGPILHI